MESQLAKTSGSGVVIDPDQLALIKRTVAKDATNDELELYLYDCKRRGVHPLDKLLHFTKRNGKYTPITSIDFMRIRASESGEYAGSDDPLYEENNTQYPIKATVTVYRMVGGQRCQFTATARWREYAPSDLSASVAFMWRKMPYTMLGKCSEALALRKAFPGQLQGLYAKEELDQANNNEPRMAPDQAKAFVTEKMKELAPKHEPQVIHAETSPLAYAENGNQATIEVQGVDKATGRAGEYRKVRWNGGQASCFEATQFDVLDSLATGSVIVADIKKNAKGYTNIVQVTDVTPPESQATDYDESLFVQEDEYATS
jgi:phage recombination protein Bet